MTSVALIMVMLDNLVVSTALNVIRQELGATIEQLEWTVNAYTLTFAVFLLTGAALGDRFGRRRMFIIGVAIFTAFSARRRWRRSIETLLLARVAQGIGAAIVTPLTLTLLSAAVPSDRRGLALGGWGAVGGLAIAIGPLVGGAIVGRPRPGTGSSGSTCPSASPSSRWPGSACSESHGPAGRLDVPGVVLASVGLLGIVWALVNGNSEGWTSPPILAAFAVGCSSSLAAFVLWERRAPAPMLPLALLRQPHVQLANVSVAPHELRDVRGHLPAGPVPPVRALLLPARGRRSPSCPGRSRRCSWRPIAGALSDRIGGGLLMGVGLTLQAIGLAWIGLVSSTTVEYVSLVLPFIISGIGMGLFFAPVANVLLSSVRPDEEGQASGAGNAIRELGGVFGVAVLAAIFARTGLVREPAGVRRRHRAGRLVGAIVVAFGAVAAFVIPRRSDERRRAERWPDRSLARRAGARAGPRQQRALRRAPSRARGSPVRGGPLLRPA